MQCLKSHNFYHVLQVAASANYLLSHIFINEDDLANPAPSKPSKKQQAEPSSSEEEEDYLYGKEGERAAALNVTTVGTQSLTLPSVKHGEGNERHQRRFSVKALYAPKEEKAKIALKHVVKVITRFQVISAKSNK